MIKHYGKFAREFEKLSKTPEFKDEMIELLNGEINVLTKELDKLKQEIVELKISVEELQKKLDKQRHMAKAFQKIANHYKAECERLEKKR